MTCYLHPTVDASGFCAECNRALCHHCLKVAEPPTCNNCLGALNRSDQKTYKKMWLYVAIGALAGMWVGAREGLHYGFFMRVFWIYAFAMIPLGWMKLPKIPARWALLFVTPVIGWFGWMIYFITKFVVSYAIGVFYGPVMIYKIVTGQKTAAAVQQNLAERSASAGSL